MNIYFLLLTLITNMFYVTAEKISHLKASVAQDSRQPLRSYVGDTQYTARQDTGLSHHELNYLCKRLPLVAQHLSLLIGKETSINETPIISCIGSGGGYRAMIGFAGFLEGLEEINLINALSYTIGLSGSTWTLSSLFVNQKQPSELIHYLKERVKMPFTLNNVKTKHIFLSIKNKLLSRQKITLCDIWGGIISNFIFYGQPYDGQNIRLESLISCVDQGQNPYPIFTSIIDELSNYEWMEFTPHEIGSDPLKVYIPSDCLGKKFKNGISYDTRPGVSLSYLVGLFGSAYAFNAEELVKNVYKFIIQSFDNKLHSPFEFFENLRISPPMVRNITRDIEGAPLSTEKYMVLVDAGLDCNLPFPPAIKRHSNLILCCDMSASVEYGEEYNELKKTEIYMRRKNLPFPTIDYTNIQAKTASLFYDPENLESPIILYFPNQHAFPTLKFEYTEEEFCLLSKSMKQAVISSQGLIYDAIKLAYERQALLTQQQKPNYHPVMQPQ